MILAVFQSFLAVYLGRKYLDLLLSWICLWPLSVSACNGKPKQMDAEVTSLLLAAGRNSFSLSQRPFVGNLPKT